MDYSINLFLYNILYKLRLNNIVTIKIKEKNKKLLIDHV